MAYINEIRNSKHHIEDSVINLFKFVSSLQDDDDLNAREDSYLHNVKMGCLEILTKLAEF